MHEYLITPVTVFDALMRDATAATDRGDVDRCLELCELGERLIFAYADGLEGWLVPLHVPGAGLGDRHPATAARGLDELAARRTADALGVDLGPLTAAEAAATAELEAAALELGVELDGNLARLVSPDNAAHSRAV